MHVHVQCTVHVHVYTLCGFYTQQTAQQTDVHAYYCICIVFDPFPPSNTKSTSEMHPLKLILLCRFCKDSADTDDIDGPGDEERNSAMLQLAASKLKKVSNDQQEEDSKPKRTVQLNLSVTETDCVVVEDRASLESNAVVLKVHVICLWLHVHVQFKKRFTVSPCSAVCAE